MSPSLSLFKVIWPVFVGTPAWTWACSRHSVWHQFQGHPDSLPSGKRSWRMHRSGVASKEWWHAKEWACGRALVWVRSSSARKPTPVWKVQGRQEVLLPDFSSSQTSGGSTFFLWMIVTTTAFIPLKQESLKREKAQIMKRHLTLSEETAYTIIPEYLQGIGSRTHGDTKTLGCSRSSYKMVSYLHIAYTHPPIYFRSSLDYL